MRSESSAAYERNYSTEEKGGKAMDVARLLRVLGDETRLRMLHLLRKKTLCVCDLMELLRISQPNASQHLNRLRSVGLVICERRAQWMFYRLNEALFSESAFLAALFDEEVPKMRVFREDEERMRFFVPSMACGDAFEEQGGGMREAGNTKKRGSGTRNL